MDWLHASTGFRRRCVNIQAETLRVSVNATRQAADAAHTRQAVGKATGLSNSDVREFMTIWARHSVSHVAQSL